jgi:hypothetical protein
MLGKKPSELDTEPIEEVFLVAGIVERQNKLAGSGHAGNKL